MASERGEPRRRLLLIRHAESQANVTGSLHCAVPGPPLSEAGHRQAADLAATLGGEPIVAVWASTMTRAQQTAEPLAEKLGLPVRTRPDLREAFIGDLNDRHDDEAHQLFDELSVRWYLDGDLSARRPEGESGHEIVERVTACLREIVADLPAGGTAAVVSHSAALRLTIPRVAIGVTPEYTLRNHLANTAHAEVEIHGDDDWRCVRWAGSAPA